MPNSPAKRVAFTGILFALALAFNWMESLLTPLFGLPPGVRLGLANVVVMYALLFLGGGAALPLVALKAGFVLLTRGVMAGLLSAAGGLASLCVMALLLLPERGFSVLVLSVAGAMAHNAGQLAVVCLWFGQGAGYYAPVLLLSGVGMGCLTAALLRVLNPVLQKAAPAQTSAKHND